MIACYRARRSAKEENSTGFSRMADAFMRWKRSALLVGLAMIGIAIKYRKKK